MSELPQSLSELPALRAGSAYGKWARDCGAWTKEPPKAKSSCLAYSAEPLLRHAKDCGPGSQPEQFTLKGIEKTGSETALNQSASTIDDDHSSGTEAFAHIAQPALSRQIKQLEAALGIYLFDRAPRRLHLTIEGRELAGRLPALFSQIDHLTETVKGASTGGTGLLRIGDGSNTESVTKMASGFRAALPT